jgi:hypothetical protein
MEITQETINVLFLLMPGFVSSIILDTVVTRDSGDTFTKITEALVFSFLIYSATNFFMDWEPLVSQTTSESGNEYTFSTNLPLLAMTLSLSILLPLIIGALIHNDIHTKLFRFLHITDKTSRTTVWQDVYVNEKRHVLVTIKDGRRVYGWPMYYSHRPKENHLYLFQPAWVTNEGEFIECNTHGILLDYTNIEFIEFMPQKNEDLTQYTKETKNE